MKRPIGIVLLTLGVVVGGYGVATVDLVPLVLGAAIGAAGLYWTFPEN